MYRDYFLPGEEAPLGYGIFEDLLKTLLKDGFCSNDIINGFRKMNFDGSCLQIEFEKSWGMMSDPGRKYSTPKETYDDIFTDRGVQKAFEIAFAECLDKGCNANHIIDALYNLKVSPLQRGWNAHKYREISSDKICMAYETALKEGDK